MTPQPLDVLVLAGSRSARDRLTRDTGASHRALVPLQGRPLLAHVLGTLRRCTALGHIAVCIDADGRRLAEQALDALPDSWVPSAASPVRSVLGYLDQAPRRFPLFVTTADHALLTPTWVDAFLGEALVRDADFVAGVVRAAPLREAYPESRRTVLRFADTPLCGANLFLLRTPRARAAVAFWVRAETHRKTPWKLVNTFGVVPMLRFVSGRLGFEEALETAGAKLGIRVAGVFLPDSEAAIDVDRVADLELAEAILSRRASQS